MYKKTLIYVDARTGRQITAAGVAVVHAPDYLRLLRTESAIVCLQFYTVSGATVAAAPLDPASTFFAYGDVAYNNSTLMFLAEENALDPDHDGVNDPGDWIDGGTADPALGRLSFRLDTSNSRFSAALAETDSKTTHFVTEAIPPGATDSTVLAKFPITAENRPTRAGATPKPDPAPDYLTAVETLALVRSAPQYQYSADGEIWHATLAAGDLYQRSRAGSSGAWSDAQNVPFGPSGPRGYNFDPDASGTLAGRDAHDAEAANFSYLDTGAGNIYIKLSATSGDWSTAIPFRGPQGIPGEIGLTVIADPISYPAANHDTYDRVRVLDATTDKLFYLGMQDKIRRVRFNVISNDDVISGNFVIVPIVADDKNFTSPTELDAVVLAAGLTVAEVSFDLTVDKKFLKFERRTAHESDTLHDSGGEPISVIITKTIFEVLYA